MGTQVRIVVRARSIGYLLTYILSGSINFFMIKFGLEYSGPLAFMMLRYAIAGTALTIASLVRGRFRLIVSKDMAFLTIFTVASTFFWFVGLLYVDPGSSAVLSYTMPLFAVPLSMVLLKERPGLMSIVGTLVGFLGVVLYGSSSIMSGLSWLGVSLTITNALFWALFSIYFKKLGGEDPLNVTAEVFVLGAIILISVSLVSGELFRVSFTLEFLTYLLVTSLIGGALLFLLWNIIINSFGVSRAVSYVFSIPALTLFLDYLILGRVPTIMEVLGSLVMFLGIYLSQRGS